MTDTGLAIWEPYETVRIPTNSDSAEQLVAFARQLGERESRAIVRAFEDQDYEMMASYVWNKAAAALKTQISMLGMDFVGEMLERSDIDEDSDPVASIRDHEAVKLAEQLGMVDGTEGMRLRQAIETVNHFLKPNLAVGANDGMHKSEAVSVLRACIKSVLGLPKIDVAYEFKNFRQRLENESLSPRDPTVLNYSSAPYFFRRTTLSVLLSLLKTAVGAQLEHVIGNVNVFLPALWGNLKQPERWTTGNTYAELYSAGAQAAAIGLRKALQTVRGFDYVPETLRSSTFIGAAQKVIDAHYARDNFYNESEPMRTLSELGTTIPKPAFPTCMTATLCVKLGNQWGRCWGAQSYADTVLKNLRIEQLEYLLNECLPSDTAILSKIAARSGMTSRWRELVLQLDLKARQIVAKRVANLVAAPDDDRAAHAAEVLLRHASS